MWGVEYGVWVVGCVGVWERVFVCVRCTKNLERRQGVDLCWGRFTLEAHKTSWGGEKKVDNTEF
jgi:hypothetical protein